MSDALPPPPTPAEDRAAYAALLEVVARLVMVEFDADSLHQLAGSDVLDLLDQLEPGTADSVRATASSADAIELLAAEFCRLFLLTPGATNPVASAFDPSAGDSLAARILQWEQELGIETDAGPWGYLPPDHLGRLIALRSIAAVDGRQAVLDDIERHAPREWLTRFGNAILAATEAPVYRAAARLLIQLTAGAPDEGTGKSN